jgi:single-strand DNA-binding protein
MSTPVTLTGRLTKDPELAFAKSGNAYARFTIATDQRVLNKTTNEWESKDSTFWNCTAFGALAENIAESLTKGLAVIATGRASQEDWTDKQGNKRTSIKVVVDEIGPTLRFATVKVAKGAEKNSGAGQQQHAGAGAAPAGWGGGYTDEPPF